MFGSRLSIVCVLLLTLILTLSVTAVSQQRPERTGVIPGISHENYPCINGSTSTRPLGDLLRCSILGLPGELRRTTYGGDSAVIVTFPVKFDTTGMENYTGVLRKSYHMGTHQSYMRLISEKIYQPENGGAVPVEGSVGYPGPSDDPYGPQADLILVARAPSDDELKAAKEKGVEFDIRPVALDAFVFLVNVENPVKSLTISQIRSIYSGKVTNWRHAGGKDEQIQAFTRERNSGSQELMEKLVMKGQEMIKSEEAVALSMSGPIDRVSQTPNGLAYSVYYYEHIMNPNPRNRLLAINGVYPTPETIASRRYPFTAEVYVVTRKGMDKNSPAIKIRDWLLSNAGQQLVAKSGYVPVKPVKK